MKRCIKYLVVALLLFSFSTITLKAKSPFAGTCTCFYSYTVDTKRYNCEDYYKDSSFKLSDFPEGVCEEICLANNAQWYGRLGEEGVNVWLSDNTTAEEWTKENSKDCVENKESTETEKNNCKYSYSKDACNALENGTWNSSTNCCDLTKVCWLHLETGMNSEGGTLYWSEVSPCTLESNISKYVNQKCEVQNNISESKCSTEEGKKSYGGDLQEEEKKVLDDKKGNSPSIPDLDFSEDPMTCEELLGPNLTKIVHLFFTILRVAGAIIALVKATMLLLPAVVAKDAEALKKAGKSCVMLAIALAIIGLLPTIANIIGKILDFDITCLI